MPKYSANQDIRDYMADHGVTQKMLADELDFEENTVVLALEALERLNMLEVRDGHLAITGWAEHQNIEGMDKIRENKRVAQAKYRAKQKAQAEASTVDTTVDTTRYLVDSIEEEREEDKEKEKEFHSFNLAQKDDLSAENVEKSVEKYVENFKSGKVKFLR